MYISAASAPEQEAAETAGHWHTLVDAGAEPMYPGCAQCIGLGPGLLEAGELESAQLTDLSRVAWDLEKPQRT